MNFTKLNLDFRMKKPVLALGAHTKNTVCFARGGVAYLSPVSPDLGELPSFMEFEKYVKFFLRKCPSLIAHDLHPEYESTRYTLELNRDKFEFVPVQHHHAHVLSCMAEHGLGNRKVIGVVLDGTGLGADARMWGAEFMVCNYAGFMRKGHLLEIPLLGLERAVRQPWRAAAAWIDTLCDAKLFRRAVKFIRGFEYKKWEILRLLKLRNTGFIYSSSMGRLFDAVGCLVFGEKDTAREAQLAVALEKAAYTCDYAVRPYGFDIIKKKDSFVINPGLLFGQLIEDLEKGKSKAEMSLKFHLAVADMVKKSCLLLGHNTGIKDVVLSGGVFQNRLLSEKCRELLEGCGFRVYGHEKISCTDAGVSLGQAAAANFRS